MTKIYSYVLRQDCGSAPNPFGGICTLTICKPVIRRNAQKGDWIIGCGSSRVKLKDGKFKNFSDKIVYAMKITDIKTLKEYDEYCRSSLTTKIPQWNTKDYQLRIGDCIYDYSKGEKSVLRESVHKEWNKPTDESGINALLSNCFYYFGVEAQPLPPELKELIKKNQGHKKIERIDLIEDFEKWITQFEKNKVYADPQMRWFYDREITDKELVACAKKCLNDDKNESEETIC
ncbi:MAG: hypothetical protein FWC39_02125 [Bacteroidetes bacterium]|nr:hypothetical protein [Bacteroidota bacterium]